METFNKEKIKDFENSNLTIYWWNFGKKTLDIVSKFKNGNKVCTGKLKAITIPADNLDYSYYDTEEEARKQNKF